MWEDIILCDPVPSSILAYTRTHITEGCVLLWKCARDLPTMSVFQCWFPGAQEHALYSIFPSRCKQSKVSNIFTLAIVFQKAYFQWPTTQCVYKRPKHPCTCWQGLYRHDFNLFPWESLYLPSECLCTSKTVSQSPVTFLIQHLETSYPWVSTWNCKSVGCSWGKMRLGLCFDLKLLPI